MKRMAWIAFAHLLLVISPGAHARIQSSISAPGNFTGTATSDTSIRWSWNAVLGSSTTLGATHYELQEESTNNVIATIPGPGTTPVTFDETGLSPGTMYCRHVVAFNGPNSASTTDVCITTTGGTALDPTAPLVNLSDMLVTLTSSGAVDHSFMDQMQSKLGDVLDLIARQNYSTAINFLSGVLNFINAKVQAPDLVTALSDPINNSIGILTTLINDKVRPPQFTTTELICGLSVKIVKESASVTFTTTQLQAKYQVDVGDTPDCFPVTCGGLVTVIAPFKTPGGATVYFDQTVATVPASVELAAPGRISLTATASLADLKTAFEALANARGVTFLGLEKAVIVLSAVGRDSCLCREKDSISFLNGGKTRHDCKLDLFFRLRSITEVGPGKGFLPIIKLIGTDVAKGDIECISVDFTTEWQIFGLFFKPDTGETKVHHVLTFASEPKTDVPLTPAEFLYTRSFDEEDLLDQADFLELTDPSLKGFVYTGLLDSLHLIQIDATDKCFCSSRDTFQFQTTGIH